MCEPNNSSISVYIPLLIGWILGIISTLFIERWKQWTEKKRIKKGILTELKDNQIHLASVCYVTTFDYGIFNKDFISWWKPYYTRLMNTGDYDFLSSNKDIFDKLFDLNDSELLTYKNVVRTNTNPKSSHDFKSITTPYIDSKIDSISHFNEDFQSSLLKIKREIGFINKNSDQIWYYLTKTFDNSNPINDATIKTNLDGTFRSISRRTKNLVNLIEKFINTYS